LLLRAAWTSFTLSLDMRALEDARRLDPMLLLLSCWVCTSLLELLDPLPRLLLPIPEDPEDFCDSDEEDPVPLGPLVCDQLCGTITNMAPLSTRLDNTVVWVFFISASFPFLNFIHQ